MITYNLDSRVGKNERIGNFMTKEIKGLTSAEVRFSLETHGDNSLRKEKRKGFFRRLLENLSDPIIKILMIALVTEVIVTFGNCNYFEVGGIVAAIFLASVVSTVSEYRSECAFEKMESDSLGEYVSVLRDGEIKKLSPSELVIGDVVYVYAGERIPADGTILSGRVSVDQSALNGESAECPKWSGKEDGWDLSSNHALFRGSVVTDGNAIMRVGRVGAGTYYGMVAKDVQTETRESPLKLRLARLASQISKIGYVIAIIVGVFYLFGVVVVDNGFDGERILASIKDFKSIFATLTHALTLMITVVVVAAPEGLPMMITVVLSANMKRMLSDSILVKKLVGIETAGSMNILFTDKTGTITVGRPQCERIITGNETYKSLRALSASGEIYKQLILSAKYNTDVIKSAGELTGGNATDRGIYEFFDGAPEPSVRVVKRVPFSSERKYSSVLLEDGRHIIKGAAEIIISASQYVLNEMGESVAFNSEKMLREYRTATARGERVLAVAVGKGESLKGLTLVALIVMKDKVRAGVKNAVREVLGAGIQIVMITGDGKETATAIAAECGIMSQSAGHLAINAEELHSMTDDEIKQILPKIRVISRALPQDKTRLVRLSQELNLVVGMTGDGINDAPSLKLADVGFAMGSGTDIAKSAADIVILDNSFSAIDKTVLYGRTIFKSIRKFITFQLIMNLAACGVSLIGQIIGIDNPITIIQMLWVNIIMDTLGGLAFAGEAPLQYYMHERPKRRDEPILSREMLHQIFLSGAYTLVICTLFLTSPFFKYVYGYASSPEAFLTAFYVLFIFAGIFNCFAARCERLWILSNIGKNKPFVFIMILICVIQILMIYFGGSLFRCIPLTLKELFIVISLAFSVIPFDIVRRIVYKLK